MSLLGKKDYVGFLKKNWCPVPFFLYFWGEENILAVLEETNIYCLKLPIKMSLSSNNLSEWHQSCFLISCLSPILYTWNDNENYKYIKNSFHTVLVNTSDFYRVLTMHLKHLQLTLVEQCLQLIIPINNKELLQIMHCYKRITLRNESGSQNRVQVDPQFDHHVFHPFHPFSSRLTYEGLSIGTRRMATDDS